MPSKNKINQNIRRQARAFVQQQFTIINECVRPRPRWVPLKLWALGARIFINTDKLREFMENGVAPRINRE